MKVSLGMPYWGSNPTRKRNFEYAYERMGKLWNWYEIEWRTPIGCETRGGARNHLMSVLADGGADVVVLCDADTYVEQSSMLAAARSAYDEGGLHYPYTSYHYLTDDSTVKLLTGDFQFEADLLCDIEGPGSYGGCMAVRPDEWEKMGGTPELAGWGFEDIIASVCARNLLGTDLQWHPGRLTHLYHPSECNVLSLGYQRNIAECKRYEAADGNEEAIRALIEERK